MVIMLSPDRLEKPFGGVGVQLARLMPFLSQHRDITIIGPGQVPAVAPSDHLYLPILLHPILHSQRVTSSVQHLLQAAYLDVGLYAAQTFGTPSLVHATDSQTAFAGILLARRLGVPLVFTVQLSYWLLSEGLELGDLDQETVQMAYEIEAAAIREAAAVIMVSRAYLDRFAREFPDQAHKFHYIPNGVDVPRTSVPKSESITVGYIGRCSEQKGVGELLAAVRHPDWPEGVKLRWAGNAEGGSGELWGQAVQTAYYHPDKLELVGYLEGEAKAEFLQSCHAGLFPSRHEPFGIAGLEWLAHGTPLITTAVDGIADYANADNAIVVELSAESILNGVRRAVTEPQTARIEAGRRTAEQYKWDAVAAQIGQIYADCEAV